MYTFFQIQSTRQSGPHPPSTHLELPPDSPPPQVTTPTRTLSKRLQSLSTRLKPPVKGAKVKEEQDGVFPGGDAMREVFSRLQCYQENMEMQIDVSYKSSTQIELLMGVKAIDGIFCARQRWEGGYIFT